MNPLIALPRLRFVLLHSSLDFEVPDYFAFCLDYTNSFSLQHCFFCLFLPLFPCKRTHHTFPFHRIIIVSHYHSITSLSQKESKTGQINEKLVMNWFVRCIHSVCCHQIVWSIAWLVYRSLIDYMPGSRISPIAFQTECHTRTSIRSAHLSSLPWASVSLHSTWSLALSHHLRELGD